MKVGTTFASMLQMPQIANTVTYKVPFGSTWSIGITNFQSAAGWYDPNNLVLSLTNLGPTSLEGTNVTTDGTNIYYGGPLTSSDSFSYAVADTYMTSFANQVNLMPYLPFSNTVSLNGSGNPVLAGNGNVGAAGYVFGVEDTTNLLPHSVWIEAGHTTVNGSGGWIFTDTGHTNPPVIFYRIYYPDNPSSPPQ